MPAPETYLFVAAVHIRIAIWRHRKRIQLCFDRAEAALYLEEARAKA